MKNLPNFTIQELMDVGAHFGHRTMRWNPKMSPYLFGSRDNIHIIDLQKTVPLLYKALEVVHDVVKNNGR
ncbi:MAG: 30S ribosomal protein S2, partial [Methanobacterium sp.]